MRLHDVVFHRDPLAARSVTFDADRWFGPPSGPTPFQSAGYAPMPMPIPRWSFLSGGNYVPLSSASFPPMAIYDLLMVIGSLRNNLPAPTLRRLAFHVNPTEYSNLRLWLNSTAGGYYDPSNCIRLGGTMTVMGVTILSTG